MERFHYEDEKWLLNLDVQKIKFLLTCFTYALSIAHWKENNTNNLLDSLWFSYESLSDFKEKKRKKKHKFLSLQGKKTQQKKFFWTERICGSTQN